MKLNSHRCNQSIKYFKVPLAPLPKFKSNTT